MRVTQFIGTFQNLIQALIKAGNNNVVIGGSQALIAHGLNIGRVTDDIDVIIYKPTSDQLSFLKSMSDFDLMKDGMGHLGDFGTYGGRRCMKFKRGGLNIDILVEMDEDTPKGLLYIKDGTTFYPVQSVSNVVRAKQSYRLDDSHEPNLYTRRKDAIDLIALKNLNFNYELPSTDGCKAMTAVD